MMATQNENDNILWRCICRKSTEKTNATISYFYTAGRIRGIKILNRVYDIVLLTRLLKGQDKSSYNDF